MKTTIHIPGECIEDLTTFCARLLEGTGGPSADASLTAAMFVENNLVGIDSHGVRLLPICIERLNAGGINPHPSIRVEVDRSSIARIDGDNGLGQVVATAGMSMAMEMAKSTGFGFVVCTNTNNVGALGRYTEMALQDHIPSMFAAGGTKRVVANAPLSISFPGRPGDFLLDICLGQVAWNRIYMQRDKGEDLPAGWAVDKRGKPTTDPIAAADGGSVVPIGNHKGYGLALAIELLTAVLGGHLMTDAIRGLFDDPAEGEGVSVGVAALDVSAMMAPDLLSERVAELFRFVKSSPAAEGVESVMIPGESRERTRANRLRDGFFLPPEVVRPLALLGDREGVPFPVSLEEHTVGGDE